MSGKRQSSKKTAASGKSEGRALDEREQRFVKEYVVDFDVERAALAAGYSASMAKSKAYQWVRPGKNPKPHVYEAIETRRAEMAEKLDAKLEITTERVLLEVARIAFFDPRKLFDADGRPKEVTQLDDDTVAAIAGLDVLEEFDSDGQGHRVVIGHVKKWKLADKKGALDMLMKHKGLYEKDNGQHNNALRDLLATMARSALPVVKRPADGN